MKHYVGIDLGTTNSAICTFDGETVRLYKSPDTNDVTPSAIFVPKRGNKYFGARAYDNAARSPDNAARWFKRFMGTNTPINLPAVDLVMSPEQCSAEILRVLFGYLPEELRNDPDTGTVITVPAAFNQMQKDATMSAAELAGLGKVALMQEPVAAVMSVVRHRKGDGIFLVYDLGGGTLDIAIAESINSRVSLLAHGGIAMCGGRDFDRLIFDNVVKSWLLDHFKFPENFSADRRYNNLRHMALWATEKAKIELSATEEAVISLDDSELKVKDLDGGDVYLDITLNRTTYDDLIASEIAKSVEAARETMEKAGLNAHDIGRIVFVGGPTQYKPLRDRVAQELGIAASADVNPMIAVAEGAAVFAESIDWNSQSRGRKSGRGAISSGGSLDVSFNFMARTPGAKARLIVKVGGKVLDGAAFQVDSLETGWSSGHVALLDDATLELPLSKPGENLFKVFVFDAAGGSVRLAQDKITIVRTAASIDAIPASHSIGIEILDRVGGRGRLEYLVREGDQLPKSGRAKFKAGESLRAGAPGSLKFKLWEGEIKDPITDNRFIGMFEIKGAGFSDGVIAKGAELICEYEVLDSGNIVLEVTIPSVSGSFRTNEKFYSRQDGQMDYTKAAKQVEDEKKRIEGRIDEIASKVDDPKLDAVRERLNRITSTDKADDPESAKKAMDGILEVKKLLARAREEHLKVIRQMDLDKTVAFFSEHVRKHAKPAEESSFDNLTKTAHRAIGNPGGDFEGHLDELRGRNFIILWRQDWFVIDRFNWYAEATHLFTNANEHVELCNRGKQALQANDIGKLREIVDLMSSMRIGAVSEDELLVRSNILAG